ncbi:hypothetical protein GCM10029964_128550 [Kibdelosporangium lantanae]
MAKKTSEDLVDEMTGMAAEIRRLAVAETRRDLAAGIEEHFLGTKSSRKGYTGTPDECVIEALDDFPTMRDPDSWPSANVSPPTASPTTFAPASCSPSAWSPTTSTTTDLPGRPDLPPGRPSPQKG